MSSLGPTAVADTVASSPKPARTFGEAFERAAVRAGTRTAALDGQHEMSYAELDRASRAAAAQLLKDGVGPGDRVGVMVPRGVDILTAIVAVLRIGAVYVPFDLEQPARRLERQARAASLRAVVTTGRLGGALPGVEPDSQLSIVEIEAQSAQGQLDLPAVTVSPDDPAYVIFTSGSTGTPKGVQVSHRSLLAFLDSMDEGQYYSSPGARVAWNASVAFDASVQQWVRLLRGDTLAMLPDDVRRDPFEFADFVRAHQLVDIDMTPSHAAVLIQALEEVARDSHPLRLLVAGEAVTPQLWSEFQRMVADGVMQVANLYGPTETTVNVLGTQITPDAPVNSGRPLPGVEARVVDERLTPIPPGEVGELCIVGPCVAEGYVNQPGLTATKFVPDPLATSGERMYRTGDLVRCEADGTYHYLGRTDDQIKIRGHRVELGEIESVMAEHPSVARAVVFYGLDGPDELTAVLCLKGDGEAAAVQELVDRELPSWMRPSRYEVVDVVPMTTSGKTDRMSLRERVTLGAPNRTTDEKGMA